MHNIYKDYCKIYTQTIAKYINNENKQEVDQTVNIKEVWMNNNDVNKIVKMGSVYSPTGHSESCYGF